MPDFCCKMLDEHGGTLFPSDITVENLDIAIRLFRDSSDGRSATRTDGRSDWPAVGLTQLPV